MESGPREVSGIGRKWPEKKSRITEWLEKGIELWNEMFREKVSYYKEWLEKGIEHRKELV